MRLISGEALRFWMDEKQVSLYDLSKAAGVSKGFVSHLTAGRKKTCKPATADAIARRLGVPLVVLFVPSVSSAEGSIGNQQRKAA